MGDVWVEGMQQTLISSMNPPTLEEAKGSNGDGLHLISFTLHFVDSPCISDFP